MGLSFISDLASLPIQKLGFSFGLEVFSRLMLLNMFIDSFKHGQKISLSTVKDLSLNRIFVLRYEQFGQVSPELTVHIRRP